MNQPLDGRTALVTGANGGLGHEFVHQALALGAQRVYAAARSPRSPEAWGDDRIVPIPLDVTDGAAVARAVEAAPEVDLLINNAGIAPAGDSIATGSDAELRRIFETNVFGPLALIRAFAPVLASHGGGAVLNVLSAAAWSPVPTAYAASKTALWGATNGLRAELLGQGTQVTGLLVGMVDTEMASRWDVPKVSAASVVAQAYDGIASGALEVLADDTTRQLKGALSTPGEQLYPWLHEQLAAFVP